MAAGEFAGAGFGRAGGVRRGVHQDPAQVHRRVGLARAGQVHPAVFQHPVAAAGGGGLAGVPPGGVVHRGAGLRRQRGEQPGRDPGRAQRRDEPYFPGSHRRRVRVGDQLRIARQQKRARPGDLLQRGHRPGDLRHLRRPAVVGAVEDRYPAVPADRQPGLDLLQIRPAVLRMPPPRRRVLLIRLRVGAVQRNRGQIPVQPGHIHTEPGDRRRPDTAGDLVQMRGDRVQRPGDPVVVEQLRRDAVRLLHRHRRRPLVHPQHRRRRGQPAGHQRLDHLAVGDPGHRPDRAQLINDLRDPQPAPELRHHRQRPQPLFQHPDNRDLRPRPPAPPPGP